MISKRLVLFGIVSALVFSFAAGFNSIYAAPITIDLHKAKNPGPGFDTQKIGSATIDTTDNNVQYQQLLQQRQNQIKHLKDGL